MNIDENIRLTPPGIGRCPHYAVEHFLETGALRILFAEHETIELGLYALYPPNRHLTARVRALIDHLVGAFRE